MDFNKDKFTSKSGEMIKVTPQCTSCANYAGPGKCNINIIPGGDVLLNRIKCRGYEQK